MKYKLPRQVLSAEITSALIREIKRAKLKLPRLSAKKQQALAKIFHIIERKGLPDYLVCKKLPGHLGRGLFLHPHAKPILKGEVIASYAGEVSLLKESDIGNGSYAFTPLEKMHLTKEEQKLFDPKRTYSSGRLYLFMVDAKKEGNFTRFINHSEEPNVIAIEYQIPKNSYGLSESPIEVIYIAKTTIHPGEQLLVSYEEGEKSYWKPFKIKPFHMTPKTFHLFKGRICTSN